MHRKSIAKSNVSSASFCLFSDTSPVPGNAKRHRNRLSPVIVMQWSRRIVRGQWMT
jgi:hypothetical protein